MLGETGRGGSRAKVWAAFFAIYVFWGSTFLFIKILVESVPPLTAAGVRFLIAGTIVYGWARWRGARRPTTRERWNLALLGLLMFLPPYAALFWAERSLPSGIAAVFVATLPLSTALIEAAWLKRRAVTPTLVLALVVGFGGVLLLSTGSMGGAHGFSWLPCMAIIFGEFCWAIGSVVAKRIALPRSTFVTAGGQMFWGGTLLLTAGAMVGEWPHVAMPSATAVGALSYLILIGSIVAFSAYVWLLTRTSPTRLSSFSYVNPVVALALGYEFAGERLTIQALWASVLVLVSVILVQWATRQEAMAASSSAPASATPADRLTPRTAGSAS